MKIWIEAAIVFLFIWRSYAIVYQIIESVVTKKSVKIYDTFVVALLFAVLYWLRNQ